MFVTPVGTSLKRAEYRMDTVLLDVRSDSVDVVVINNVTVKIELNVKRLILHVAMVNMTKTNL